MTSRERRKPLVLLVEDDRETQTLLKLVLRKDYEVLTAASAPEAKAELAAHPRGIRLVLMDLLLEGPEDGIALTRYIRSRHRWHDLPIIVTTARTLPEDESQARSAGATEFLAKPFYPRQLLNVLEHYLPPGTRPKPRKE